MKTLATKLTTTSLLAIAICAAPSGLAQEAEKSQQATPVKSPAQGDQTAPTSPGESATQNAAATANSDPQTAKTAAGAEDQKNQDSAAQANAAAEQPKANAHAVAAMASAANKEAAPGGNLRIATEDMKKYSADKLAGRELRSSDGKEIGEVKEFLVDARTGEVAYGIISSGGLAGIGDELRLVPMKALKATGDDRKFTVSIDANQWKQLPTIQEKEFKDGNFTIADGPRRQLERQFMKDESATDAAAYYTASNTEHLIRASALEGRKVRSGNATAGKIESVVIDLDHGTASALFEPEKEFAGSDQKFLVPLGQLTLVGGKRVEVTTMLTAADFKQAQTGGQNIAANRETNETAKASTSAVAASIQQSQSTTNENKASEQVASSTTGNAEATTTPNAQGASSEKVASTEQPASTTSTTAGATETVKSSDTSSGTSSIEAKQSIATNDSPSAAAATSATVAQSETTASGERGAAQQKDSIASADRTTPTRTDGAAASSTTSVSGDQQAQEVASSSTPASSTSVAGTSQSQKDEPLAPTGRSDSQNAETDRVASAESKPSANSSASNTSTEGKSEVAASGATSTQSTSATADAAPSKHPRTATNEATTVADSTPARSSSSADTTPRTAESSEPKAEPNSGEGQTQRSSEIAANTSTTPQNTDENLTPTGRTSAEQNLNADPELVTAAQAIRKALDDDPSFARLDVRVTPESGKLHLRGTVQSDDLKRSIEEKAKEAAGSQEIKSELKVGNK